MILYWLEDPLEFLKFNNYFLNTSMEELWINLLILMKLLLTELLSKLLSWTKTLMKNWTNFFYWMLLHFLLELKLLEESWLNWSKRTPPFLSRRLKSSPLTKTTNLVFLFKFLKEKELWPRTIIFWVNSVLKESHLLREESLKSKLLLISMLMEFWMSKLKTNNLERFNKSPLPMIKEDWVMKKLMLWLKKLKDISKKMKLLRRLLLLRIILSNTSTKSRILLMNLNWKINSLKMTERKFLMLLKLLSNGSTPILMLLLKNSKLRRRRLKKSIILSSKKFMDKECQDKVCQVRTCQDRICQDRTCQDNKLHLLKMIVMSTKLID